MANAPRRFILLSALRIGFFLMAGAALSEAQEVPPTGMVPNPSQGSVDGSGKFVPAKPLAAATPKTPTTPEEWRDTASKLIQKTGEHTFRVGIVQCDRAARSLTISAQVNAREGLIEYALVTRQGKIHEALLSTDADPLHIQMAALLLGISPQPGKPPCEVTIEVEWATNGPARKLPLEDLIALAKDTSQDTSGDTMPRGPWKFTGSQIDAGGFAAARDGSIISLIEDPAALIANPRLGRENDNLHLPNASAMPGANMPVSVRILLKPIMPHDVESQTKP